MRLIDADRLEDTWNQGKTMVDNVDAQPKVDPVKHGHWVMVYVSQTGCPRCSVCGHDNYVKGNYCANCGAKMMW